MIVALNSETKYEVFPAIGWALVICPKLYCYYHYDETMNINNLNRGKIFLGKQVIIYHRGKSRQKLKTRKTPEAETKAENTQESCSLFNSSKLS